MFHHIFVEVYFKWRSRIAVAHVRVQTERNPSWCSEVNSLCTVIAVIKTSMITIGKRDYKFACIRMVSNTGISIFRKNSGLAIVVLCLKFVRQLRCTQSSCSSSFPLYWGTEYHVFGSPKCK